MQSLTENSPTSAGVESEYDTASTNSRSDNEQDEYEDDEEDSLDDEATGETKNFECKLSWKNLNFPPTRFQMKEKLSTTNVNRAMDKRSRRVKVDQRRKLIMTRIGAIHNIFLRKGRSMNTTTVR